MDSDEYWREEAPGFLGKLGELAEVDAINAKSGAFSIADVIANGGGVYVVGSMTLQAVKRAQQMIFVRIQQIATARDRMQGKQRTVCVIADEAKYHISRPVLQGLGASRDKGMRVILAFQSFMDLKDCPNDLNPDMVVGAIVENTPCKLIYRLEDPDTADWLARKSGMVLVDDEARTIEKNIVLSETALGERTVRQGEHFLFDTNKLMNLPSGWSVLFGRGVAQACYVSPYRVTKSIEAITPTAAPIAEVATTVIDAIETVPSTPIKAIRKKTGGNTDDDFFSLE
jgi:type IV secretory pathway TraG/TraD family ATPase VirD4